MKNTDLENPAAVVENMFSNIAQTQNISVSNIPVGIKLYCINSLSTTEEAFESLREYHEKGCINELCENRHELQKVEAQRLRTRLLNFMKRKEKNTAAWLPH